MEKQYFMGENGVKEYREITVTSKRQITIPKSFFDRLAIDETLMAYLTDDGIFLKPVHSPVSIYQEDTKDIIRNVLNDEGLTEDEKVEEITKRLAECNELIDRRIQEFDRDLAGDSVLDDAEDEDFNGLNIFFDTEIGKTAK